MSRLGLYTPTVNVEEQSVSGDIRTKDGQVINVNVIVPSDDSLAEEELIDATLQMICAPIRVRSGSTALK